MANAQSNQAEAKEANGQKEDSDKTYEISGSRSKSWNTQVDVSHEGDIVKPKSIDLVKGLGYMEQHLQALLKDAKKSYASLARATEKAEQIKLKSRIATDLKRATKVHNEATGSYNQIIQTSSSQEQKAIAEKSYNNIDQMLKEIDNILLDLKKQEEDSDKTYEISGSRSKSWNKPVDVSHEGDMVKPIDVDEQSAKLLAKLQGADSDVKAVLRLAQKSDEQLLVLKGKDQIPFKQSIVKYYTKAKGIYESATK
ncbi:MAG: hypothetical protein NTU89_03215, partial [Candidatus Dependentiae bacterium]|nr:hypothetical protein [Candidatus Dependentiae bacterium]